MCLYATKEIMAFFQKALKNIKTFVLVMNANNAIVMTNVRIKLVVFSVLPLYYKK